MKYCSYCGKEIMNEAVLCPHCGCSTGARELDMPNTGLNILALLFPLIGLVLYLIFHDKTPTKANKIGQFALIGFCIGTFCSLMLLFL
jgi:hypothetical protein